MGKKGRNTAFMASIKKKKRKKETEAASVHCGGACSFCGSFRALAIFVVLIVVFFFFLGVAHFFFFIVAFPPHNSLLPSLFALAIEHLSSLLL